MYALVLSDNIFTSSFLSRGLKYENIHSLPFSFRHFNPQSINVNEFDCAVVKLEKDKEENRNFVVNMMTLFPEKPLYLIKPSDFDFDIDRHNIILTNQKTTIRQIAYDMKNRINGSFIKNRERIIKVADLKLSIQDRVVERFNKKINLRNMEFHLLEFLMSNTDTVFSRQKILEQVWDRNTNMFTNTVDVHVNILRKKIDYKPGFKLIQTIHCHGYIMHSKPFK